MIGISEDGPRTKYGWSLIERRRYFDTAEKGAKTHYRVRFQGEDHDLGVIKVPLTLPRYRLENGRTAALQEEYISTKGLPENFFESDPERLDVQEVQHSLLKSLIKEQGLDRYFSDPNNRQIDPLILDHKGFVLNGNRRLCTYRELYWSNPEKFRHFDDLRAVVLPPGDDRALDRLEAELQLKPEMRADYSWYARAQMMQHRMRHHRLQIDELASFYQEDESKIKELLEMHRYAAEYLRSRGIENQWSKLQGKNEYAFRQIVKNSRGLKGSDAVVAQELAFQLIDDPSDGRLYEEIPKIKKHLNRIKSELADRFPTQKQAPLVEGDPDDPLSPSQNGASTSGYGLAEQIRSEESKEEVVDIVREAIRSEEAAKRERSSTNLLMAKVRRAHSSLSEAIDQGMTPEAELAGVLEQLDLIDEKVARIRDHVNQHAAP